MSKKDFYSLTLDQVHTDTNMACLMRNLKRKDLTFQILHIEDCPVSQHAMIGICKYAKNLAQLKELRLMKL